MTTIAQLNNKLDQLGLLSIKDNINTYLDFIANGEKTALEAFNELLEKEINRKDDLAIKGCVKVANFPFYKEIKDFDFSYQPSLDKNKIMDLMTLRFIENKENIIFSGTPGVGKTNLAVSIGIASSKQRISTYFITFHDLVNQLKQAKYENRLEARIKWYCRYKLLIIDEVGYEKMDPETANLFFNLISKRYEKSSTVITTNLAFSKWPDVFGEPILTNALLDRLLHHCSIISINGPSYRLKDQFQYFKEGETE